MGDTYGIFEDRLRCSCGTTLVLEDREGLTTDEVMKCHSCGRVYDFEIVLSNPRKIESGNEE